jgi:hypothetical protein
MKGALAAGGGGKTVERRDDPLVATAVIKIRSVKQDLTDERGVQHVCDHKVCNPQSEQAVASNVFLCKYGVIHVCTAQLCEYYADTPSQTCPISGFQLGSIVSYFDKGDARTWYSKLEHTVTAPAVATVAVTATASASVDAARPQKRPRKEIPLEDLRERAAAIVRLLLYSNARHARNKAAIAQFKMEAEEARQAYLKQQAARNQFPYFTDVYRLTGHFSSQALPLQEFVHDASLCNYYVSVIMQVWAKIAPPLPKFEDACLGVMYAMRQGIRYGDCVFLPKDDFLLMNLPIGNELRYFNIAKQRISNGDHIISELYQHSNLANLTPLDVTQLEEQREEILLDTERVPAKISSSGEKLFMPVSRRTIAKKK